MGLCQAVRAVSLVLAIGSIFAAATSRGEALEYKPVSSPGKETLLVVSGEFKDDEPLSAFANAIKASGARVIVFDSPGGSVGSALQLGRMIRAAGLDTLQVRQLQCVSACSLAFLGGVNLVAEPGSIGVHRSSFSADSGLSTDDAVARIQLGTAKIMSYMTEMGADPKLLELALSYDKSDMRYLSASEMAELRVTTAAIGPSEADTSPSSSPSPPAPESAPDNSAEQRMESSAVTFVKKLIEFHTENDEFALSQVQTFYAPIVDYYGKLTDLNSILLDKRNYFERWPERGYNIRDNSIMVTCGNDHCMVSGIYDWVVRSLPRHKQARGAANFSYTILISPTPKIVAETSKVQR